LTHRYAQAVEYASVIHATQIRKGTNIAYISHLLGVSSLVLEAGGDEDEAIAGLLHDAVEDCGGLPRLADVRARFGDRVADIVLACSDSTDEDWKRNTGYWDRKRRYLDHLEVTEDDRAILVSIADKAHNARALVTDLHQQGTAVLGKFNGTPAEIVEYYNECLRIACARSIPEAVVDPLRTAVAEIERLVGPGQSPADDPSI
jgi:(p)ppGpp synthase/HD superfamily hydrolase